MTGSKPLGGDLAPAASPPHRGRRRGAEGQSLVEFSVLVPAFLLMLFGMLEFGFVFTHNLTLEYATREGARTGAALSNGNNVAATCATIDQQIIAAVERVLKSPGSPIVIASVTQIQIWKSTATGTQQPGNINTWTWTGPNSGPTVDGQKLDFSPPATDSWPPCTRSAGSPADSVGVSLSYNYTMVTPLAAITKFFGGVSGSTLSMGDRTVMALNP